MMQGRVKDGRASLPITFRLSNQPDFQIEFVVDTGFMDCKYLPDRIAPSPDLCNKSNPAVLFYFAEIAPSRQSLFY
jgi:predicted aspartyl protease